MDTTAPLRIGLLGYGKMGRILEQLATESGHRIVWRVGTQNRQDAEDPAFLRLADVIIEFSRPEAAFHNVMTCLNARVPVICGTTGWSARFEEAATFCQQQRGALLWASNFSIGVHIFFALNRYFTSVMNAYPFYQPSVTEIHHARKLDMPSGTAITLAEHIIAASNQKKRWELGHEEKSPDILPIDAIRQGDVTGTHTARWEGPYDSISLTHEAHSRNGFAAGALLAAQWIIGKTGVFSMRDVIGDVLPLSGKP